MNVRDSAVARDFYGSVLGWRFTPGSVEDGWNVEDVAPVTGMWGSREQSVNVPMYLVDDIQAAAERVRVRGGSASDVSTESFGLMSECEDDQGTRFYLGQSTSARRSNADGSCHPESAKDPAFCPNADPCRPPQDDILRRISAEQH